MLPSMDGLAVLGALRAAEIRTPALILSALGSVDDRVKGLRAGGDDYLVKPFAFSELLARLEALLRRGTGPTTDDQAAGRGSRARSVDADGQARAASRSRCCRASSDCWNT